MRFRHINTVKNQEASGGLYKDYPTRFGRFVGKIVKRRFVCSSWHHTSKHYNCTDFYSVDEQLLLELDATTVCQWIEQAKANKAKNKDMPTEPPIQYGVASFCETEGTRHNLKHVQYMRAGYTKGKWFYSLDGEYKKLVSGNYFSWQENMSQQEAEQFEIEQKQKERDFENLLRTTLTTKKGQYVEILVTQELIPTTTDRYRHSKV